MIGSYKLSKFCFNSLAFLKEGWNDIEFMKIPFLKEFELGQGLQTFSVNFVLFSSQVIFTVLLWPVVLQKKDYSMNLRGSSRLWTPL